MSRMKANQNILLFLEYMVLTHGWFCSEVELFICFYWPKRMDDDGGSMSSLTCIQICAADAFYAFT